MNKTKVRRIVRAITHDTRIFFNRGSYCYYDADLNKINIDPIDFIDDAGFMRHLRDTHRVPFILWARYSLATWSLLHELGHHFCDEEVDESEHDEFVRAFCSMIPRDETDKEMQDLYFNLPREYAATEWAIEFAWVHCELCDLLDEYLVE